MSKIKIGVIGAGSMGKNHIRVYKELIDKCDLVGFYDIDKAKSDSVSRQYDVEYYENLDMLINDVDAVSIVTPTITHCEYGIMCARNKKHIMVEKPIVHAPDEAVKLIEECEKNKVVLQVGHIERFNPAVIELTNILKGQEIISMDFQRLSPYDKRITDTDVIKDLMIHDIDIMYSIVNSEVNSLYAHGKRVFSKVNTDFAQALIKFDGNILVSLTASRVTEDKVRVLTINTKDACIYVDYINRSIKISRSTSFKLGMKHNGEYKQENTVEKVYVQQYEPLKMELASFLNCISQSQKPLVGGLEGLKSLVLAHRITDLIQMQNIETAINN